MYILYVQWEPKKSGKVRRLLDLWLIMSKEHEIQAKQLCSGNRPFLIKNDLISCFVTT